MSFENLINSLTVIIRDRVLFSLVLICRYHSGSVILVLQQPASPFAISIMYFDHLDWTNNLRSIRIMNNNYADLREIG